MDSLPKLQVYGEGLGAIPLKFTDSNHWYFFSHMTLEEPGYPLGGMRSRHWRILKQGGRVRWEATRQGASPGGVRAGPVVGFTLSFHLVASHIGDWTDSRPGLHMMLFKVRLQTTSC